MALFGYDGLMGAGKSFGMFSHAFSIAQESKKRVIVCNQPRSRPLNLDALMEYALRRKWRHLYQLARYEAVVYAYDLGDLLAYKRSVVLIDEAAICLNTRDYAKIAKEAPDLIADLVQVRKAEKDVIWAAQAYDMVDKQVRQLTSLYYVCSSFGPYYIRHLMKAPGLAKYRDGHKLLKCIVGLPDFGRFDPLVFKIYDSFAIFDDADDRQRTFTPVTSKPGWCLRDTGRDYLSAPYEDPSYWPEWLVKPTPLKPSGPVVRPVIDSTFRIPAIRISAFV